MTPLLDSEDLLASGGIALDLGRQIMVEAFRGPRHPQLVNIARALRHLADRLEEAA